MAVWLSALRAGRALPPRNLPGTHFCKKLSGPQGHSAAGRIRSIEKIHLIGTRTRDLPACSIVPQPTTSVLLLMIYAMLINQFVLSLLLALKSTEILHRIVNVYFYSSILTVYVIGISLIS
jgi:hypothetical protein